MQLRLSEEQTLIDASVRGLLAGEYGFARRRDSLDAAHGCRAGLWAQFAAMGWLALPLPQAAGGLGGGALETGLLMRAFGRHLVVEPYLACAVLAARVLASQASEAQCAAWLPGLMEGRLRLALAHEEPGQRDPWARAGATAACRGGQWELRGAKSLVRGLPGADGVLVTASLGETGEEGVFLVPLQADGLRVQPARCADGAHAADLHLDELCIGAAERLDARATAPWTDALAFAVVALCWEAVGSMGAAFELTVAHARQRVQFGRALVQFQVVEHRLAEMAVCCEEALAACELAALRLDRGDGDAMALASMAKAKVGRAARFVAQQAVQLHGAMGMTEALPVASHFRQLMGFTQQHGSTDAHAMAWARSQMASGAWRHGSALPQAVPQTGALP